MKGSTGLLIIVVGIVLLWIAATGRLDNVKAAWNALLGTMPASGTTGVGALSGPGGTTDVGAILSALGTTVPSPSVPVPMLQVPMLPPLPSLSL